MKDSYVFYKDKLGKEYRVVFEQVEWYVLSQNIDDYTCEERLGDLLDIFLSAEEAGKPVQKITGNNIEQFCKTFCSDFSVKHRVLGIVDWLKLMAWLFVVFAAFDIVFFLLDAPETGDYNLWHSVSTLNISGYLIGILIVDLLVMGFHFMLRKFMFKKKWVSMKVLHIASCALAVVGFFIIFGALNIVNSHLFYCPTWIALSVSCVYLILYYVLRGRYIRREKIKFSDLVQVEMTRADFQSSFARTMEKRFERAKRRNLKRGKGELTLKAFLAREEKSCNRLEKFNIYYYVMPIVITAFFYLGSYLNEGFETVIDSVLFVVIMLAVEYPIMLGFQKIERKGIAVRREWIQTKRDALPHNEEKVAGENAE